MHPYFPVPSFVALGAPFTIALQWLLIAFTTEKSRFSAFWLSTISRGYFHITLSHAAAVSASALNACETKYAAHPFAMWQDESPQSKTTACYWLE